jgi:hypothetical protein
VTVSLTDDCTSLNILAICPYVVDISDTPDNTRTPTGPTLTTDPRTEDTTTPSNKRKAPYTTATARTYNLRTNQRTYNFYKSSDDNSTIHSSSESYTCSDDTPPPSFYDRDYNPSDNDTDEEELVINTTDSATSTSNESSDDSSYGTDRLTIHLNRTTYGLRSTGEN